MSGADLAVHAQDASAQTMSTTSEDFAATLRAAALMTLKSKRRKPTVVKAEPVPIRSLAEPPSIELDYGQEEPTGTSSIASSPVIPPATAVAHARSASKPMDVDEGAYREEGEISDSEMASATPQTKVEPQSPVLHKASPVVPQTQVEPREPVVLPTATTAVVPLLLPHEIFAIPQAPALVDENHARPGLAMTQAQYEAAKDIVLDLLGWGVPPEYLVSCGLSREIVFYVFVELNLRLPSNLDTTGLPFVPVPPSASLPEPLCAADVSRPSISHPSLPPKPQPPTETQSLDLNASHTLSAQAPPFVPSASEPAITSVASSSGTNLHDIEQQRRQELLARKAVLASRKIKKKAISSAATTTPFDGGSNSKASSLVPTKMVDDFLQSIEPVALAGSSSLSNGSVPPSPLPARPHSMYDMDVDDVPGLTTGAGLITEYTPLSRPPPTSSVSVFNQISPRSPAVLESAISSTSEFASNPPSSTATTNSFNTTPLSYGGDDDDMDAIPGLFRPHTFAGDDKPLSSRRGTKRPVAADFVDLEPGPSKLAKGIPDFFRANIRRKTAGFAGLTQRRCVIDLSDSEGDDNETAGPGGFPQWTDPRASQVVTPQATAAPTPRIRSPIITPSITPSVLQEKEEAIRRMRELIAQREESRKKKIEVPSRSTPSSSSTPTNGTVAIKQEDDESAGIRSFDPSRSSSSSTPDRTSNGRPYDSQDEQSVLATLLPHEMDQNGTISLPGSTSTSNATTPIDVTSRTMEHSTTGDKVLTDEARFEQVVSQAEENQERSPHADVDVIGHHPETSTQIESNAENKIDAQGTQQTPVFASYRSLLDNHPLLRDHSRLESASKSAPDSSRSGSSSTILRPDVDLGPLKQNAVLKYLSSGSGRICQYEVPGGGECRDQECENVHLSRLSGVEPSDEDTVQYLCNTLPAGPRYGAQAFRDALDVARLRHPTMPFDERVQEALTSLGLR